MCYWRNCVFVKYIYNRFICASHMYMEVPVTIKKKQSWFRSEPFIYIIAKMLNNISKPWGFRAQMCLGSLYLLCSTMVRQKKSFHDILEILPSCYSECFSSYWIDWKLRPEDKRIHSKPRTDYFIFQSSQKCCDLCLVLYLCVFFVG